ncbi:MAG: hypothetical protein KAI79_10745 [Bacteroidales bacterium]|nr:hypothetical protein [Bacteroidales bacterium]
MVANHQPIDYSSRTAPIIIEQRIPISVPFHISTNSQSVSSINKDSFSLSVSNINKIPNIWKHFGNNDWIIKMLLSTDQIIDTKTLVPYYKNLYTLLIKKDFNICNSILKEIDITKSNEVFLVGILRLTFTWQNELPAWKSLLNKIDQELLSRNIDSKKVLTGLI